MVKTMIVPMKYWAVQIITFLSLRIGYELAGGSSK
jgi:hypothetical protein